MKKFIFSPLSIFALSFSIIAHATPNADGEDVPAIEAKATEVIVEMIHNQIANAFRRDGHAFRDAHRKAHGCVTAKFIVQPNLPEALAQGVFATPKTYDAIVRYSNGNGASLDDRLPDGRGMAVKVLGVSGPKLLDDEMSETTQDFLMINYPIFFVRNAYDYVGFQNAVSNGIASALWWLGSRPLHEGAIAIATATQKVYNPLSTRYFSMVPSKIGANQMKFSAKPSEDSIGLITSLGSNRLRENLTSTLAVQSFSFDFQVQLRTNPATQPIEDATIEWSEDEAPFQTVAKIEIPMQDPIQGEQCEILSYTPWHSSPELRPLGGIQRVRKAVYKEISTLRHTLNQQPRKEP